MHKEMLLRAKKTQEVLGSLPGILRPRLHSSIESLISDSDLKKVVLKLFKDGHHARAVEEAFKFLNNLVKRRAGVDTSIDGANLMKRALSINNPLLKINEGVTQSEKDEQLGYMELCSGSMTGIRNPRAHEHEWEDTERHALQLIILADHLVERIRKATKP